MDYPFFKTVHIISIVTLVVTIILMLFAYYQRSSRFFLKKILAFHVIAWVLTFASSFGLVSELQLHENFPLWASIKVYSWVGVGALTVWGFFKPGFFRKTYWISIGLCILATIMAIYKPSL
jgi:hypothetical protein